jgi:hypothetical protein
MASDVPPTEPESAKEPTIMPRQLFTSLLLALHYGHKAQCFHIRAIQDLFRKKKRVARISIPFMDA